MRAAKTVVLENGLKLILLENHRLPIVVAKAEVDKVRLYEPADQVGVAALMGALLEEGTTMAQLGRKSLAPSRTPAAT